MTTIHDNLAPGRWDVTRTVGDTDVPVLFTLEWDGVPVTITSAVAQVRVKRDRTSTEVYERTCDVVAVGEVRVGDGDVIPDEPGSWWWDLQVSGSVGATAVDLTFLAGTFVILRDATN